jgi:hypothetical protein
MKIAPVAILGLALTVGLAADAFAQKRVSCGPDEYLNMQVIGTPTAPNGNVLVSDGNEFYNNGSTRNVLIRFQVDNCTYDFTPNLSNSTRSWVALLPGGTITTQFLNFDRVRSVPLTPSALLTDEERAAWLDSPFCTNGVQRNASGAIIKNTDGSYQDNYAGCGIDDAGNGYVLRAGSVGFDGEARLGFNVSAIDRPLECPAGNTYPKCGGSHLRVYHPFANQWVVKAPADAMAAYQVWVGGKTSQYVFQRFENVPLEFIITKP